MKTSLLVLASVLVAVCMAAGINVHDDHYHRGCRVSPSFTTTVKPLAGFDYSKAYLLLAIQQDSASETTGNWTPPASTYNYTLHGIWPNFVGNKEESYTTYPANKGGQSETKTGCYPAFCSYIPSDFNVRKAIPAATQAEMAIYWHSIKTSGWDPKPGSDPNAKMWLHEYSKHGTCTNGVSEGDYFAHGVEILKATEWYSACQQSGSNECFLKINYASQQGNN